MTDHLGQRGIDGKNAQDLLQQPNSRITLAIYQQTVTEERRVAQALAFSEVLPQKRRSLTLSSDRTQTNPDDPRKKRSML